MADMSERTMWKDDVHGLLLEASLADLENRNNEDQMRTLREKMASTIWKRDWDMSAYGPGVSTDPLEVQFLKALSTMKQPCRTLMFGMIGSDTGHYDLEINDNECEEMRTCRDEEVAALRALKDDLAKFIGEMIAGPILIRLAWHDSGTLDQRISSWTECGGTIGSIRFEPELSYGANAGLAKTVKNFKPFAEKYMSDSWADLIQMASAVAVEVLGGPEIEMKYGRVDATGTEACVNGASRVGFAGNAGLPDAMPPFGSGATEPAQHLRDVFNKKMGFTDQVVVAISGTHTVGRVFKDRSGACPFGYTNPTQFTNSEMRLSDMMRTRESA